VILGSFMTSLPFNPSVEPSPSDIADIFNNFFMWFPVIMLPMILGFAGWIWSISVGLHPKLPEGHGLNLTLFKSMLLVVLLISFFMFYIMINMFSEMFTMIENQTEMTEMPTWFGQMFMIFPLALISMGCSIYTYYHTAKTIKLVEKGNTQRKPEFIGEFFLIWFYYIGVWILQPKLNEMIEDDYVTPNEETIASNNQQYDN
ncbi:MAG: hypothetical protein ACI8SE_002175, partial [Bacteroidia bacterium]